MSKVLLIEVWMGPLPDYYKFHRETITKQNEIFDIYESTGSKDFINYFKNSLGNLGYINIHLDEWD
jgi:hypothetical protein